MVQLQLSSIDQAPRAIPVWDSLIEDLGNPPAHRVARVLGVGRSTVYHWHAIGGGPRIACLALFWLTSWGRSQVHAQAHNDAVLSAQLLRSVSEERDRLRSELATLERSHRELAYQLNRAELSQPPTASALAVAVAPGLPAPALAWPSISPREEEQLIFPRLDLARLALEGGDIGLTPHLPRDLSDPSGSSVKVVTQGDGNQGIERDSKAVSVTASLSLKAFRQPDVQCHGSSDMPYWGQDGTIFAPSEDFPPVLQDGGRLRLGAPCSRVARAGRPRRRS
jgi:hypothetical protein